MRGEWQWWEGATRGGIIVIAIAFVYHVELGFMVDVDVVCALEAK